VDYILPLEQIPEGLQLIAGARCEIPGLLSQAKEAEGF
jgi:hypothetical protein